MNRKLILTTLLFAGLAMPAGEPAGVYHWTAAQLKAFSSSLAPKIDQHKVAAQQLEKYGNYSFMVAHREGPGEAEYHDTQADIFVVEQGDATLTVGGKLANGRTTGPGEIRGPSITGGSQMKLGTGDIVTIPAKVPHQVILDPGKKFTYFVIKVTQ